MTFDLYLNATVLTFHPIRTSWGVFKVRTRLWTERILEGRPKSLDSSERADVCAKSQTISLNAPLRNYISKTRTDSLETQSAAIIACAGLDYGATCHG